MSRHAITPDHAPLLLTWLRDRGGVAVWGSVNLSNPQARWTTPAQADDGTPMPPPTWEADQTPIRVITDAADIDVVVPKEVARFRVAVRPGASGLQLKVTTAGSRRIQREIAKAGPDAGYIFDYATQEAVIVVPTTRVPLDQWAARQEPTS